MIVGASSSSSSSYCFPSQRKIRAGAGAGAGADSRRRHSLAVALLASFTAAAAAQDRDALCAAASDIEVGQWAAYTFQSPRLLGDTATARFAVVGAVSLSGAPGYWFEVVSVVGSDTVVAQYLAPAFPYEVADVVRAVVQSGGEPPLALTQPALRELEGSAWDVLTESPMRECSGARATGWEDVRVPAGTFRALHLVTGSGRDVAHLWASPDVPFGLLKFLRVGEDLMLQSFGGGATSSLRGAVPR